VNFDTGIRIALALIVAVVGVAQGHNAWMVGYFTSGTILWLLFIHKLMQEIPTRAGETSGHENDGVESFLVAWLIVGIVILLWPVVFFLVWRQAR
jgi:hypothetical protein